MWKRFAREIWLKFKFPASAPEVLAQQALDVAQEPAYLKWASDEVDMFFEKTLA